MTKTHDRQSGMSSRHRVQIGLASAAIAAFALINAGTADAQGTPKRGGKLVIGKPAPASGFDPVYYRRSPPDTSGPNKLLYDWFFDQDEKTGKWNSVLGTEIKEVKPNLAWQIKLRKGVKFANGKPYNAQAVHEHFKRVLTGRTKRYFQGRMGLIKEAAVIDEHTVEFRMERPSPGYDVALRSGMYLFNVNEPGHVAKVGKDLNAQPLGMGPFLLKNWSPGSGTTFVRNQNYWRGGRPYLDEIEFKVLVSDQALLNALKAGDIDLAMTTSAPTISEAKKDQNLVVFQRSEQGAQMLGINGAKPVLQDRRVRRAMAHAFDRKVMREIHYGNINTIATDFYGPGSGWGCDPKYVNYPEYDPAKAKALLKDYGKPVKFTFTTSSNPRFIILAQLYQGFWKKVGIDVDVKVLPEGASYNRLITGGKLDVWWATAAGRPDPSLVMMDLHSANKRSRYRTNNPRVDAAIEETRKAIRKPDRAKAYCNYARTIAEELPVLLHGVLSHFYIARKHVKGMRKDTANIPKLADLWIDK